MKNHSIIYLSALKYYLSSIPTLFAITNFWIIPLLLIKKPILLKLKNGLQFYIEEFMDVWVIKEIILDRQYERVRELQKGGIVIDIGAAFGDFSIFASKKARMVYAYDPNIHRISLMEKNLAINHCQNVKAIPKAVNSLNEVFSENKISHCHFLKIDCEGCEYEIFKNVSPQILSKIEFIAFEIHLFTPQMHQSYEKLKTLLSKNGFELKEYPNEVHNYLKFLFCYSVTK